MPTTTTENIEPTYSTANETSEVLTVACIDDDGCFKGTCVAQKINGELLLPPDAVTLDAPTQDVFGDEYFYFLSSDKKSWEKVKKPTTAEECIPFGEVSHTTHCTRDIILRQLFSVLTEQDRDNYKLVRNPETLSWKVEKIPEKTFDELKAIKLLELASKSANFQAYNCSSMYVTTSLGFKINADQCSIKNMETLISLLPDDETTTSYKIYDNTFKDVNRVQLAVMKSQAEQNGLALYQQKFALQAKINACTTKEELNAIEIVFVMQDYSKAVE